MLADCRPRVAAPLCNLNLADSLRLRRRHGRASYLLALFTERPSKQTAAQHAPTARPTTPAARTLPS